MSLEEPGPSDSAPRLPLFEQLVDSPLSTTPPGSGLGQSVVLDGTEPDAAEHAPEPAVAEHANAADGSPNEADTSTATSVTVSSEDQAQPLPASRELGSSRTNKLKLSRSHKEEGARGKQ
jgi:hypothetical protein